MSIVPIVRSEYVIATGLVVVAGCVVLLKNEAYRGSTPGPRGPAGPAGPAGPGHPVPNKARDLRKSVKSEQFIL